MECFVIILLDRWGLLFIIGWGVGCFFGLIIICLFVFDYPFILLNESWVSYLKNLTTNGRENHFSCHSGCCSLGKSMALIWELASCYFIKRDRPVSSLLKPGLCHWMTGLKFLDKLTGMQWPRIALY